MEEMKRNCELCNGDASIYCSSDNAFLCYSCDSKVHCANFLVARHVRSLICPCCRKFDGNRFSGAGVSLPSKISCRNCSPPTTEDEDEEEDSLSSCSSCVSSTGEGGGGGGGGGDEGETTSSRKMTRREKVGGKRRREKKVVDLKVEGVLVNWCRRLGVVEEREVGQVVSMAVELMTGCLDRITLLPFRVALAASFWVAVRVCRRGGGGGGVAQFCSSLSSSLSQSGGAACQDLKRVEQISGVPAKLILATEAKLARVLKRRQSRETHEEGWAEC